MLWGFQNLIFLFLFLFIYSFFSKFCGAADMSVEEETLLDQSNRLITSAKLLFRISSPQAAALYESDKFVVIVCC